MIVLFIGRGLMSDNPLKVPSPSRGRPVLRRTVSERRAELRVGGEVNELVIVPGHAVYLGSNYLSAKDDTNWALESYQLLEGEAKTFIEHMELGVKEVAKNPNALLLFSGGKTKSDAGAISEASSYWQVSKAFDWFGVDVGVQSRVFTEEHARDSFENLLRGKRATSDEIKSVIVAYLDGDTTSSIAESMYRSTTFVRNIIDKAGVPQKRSSKIGRAHV